MLPGPMHGYAKKNKQTAVGHERSVSLESRMEALNGWTIIEGPKCAKRCVSALFTSRANEIAWRWNVAVRIQMDNSKEDKQTPSDSI